MRNASAVIPFALTLSALPGADLKAVDIVRKATERENANLELRRQCTYKEPANQKRLDKHGKVKKNEQTVHEDFYIAGEQFRKLLAKDGQPLPEKEAVKEQKRLDKQIEKRRNENPAESARRAAKELREAREFRTQIVEASPLLEAEGAVPRGRPHNDERLYTGYRNLQKRSDGEGPLHQLDVEDLR